MATPRERKDFKPRWSEQRGLWEDGPPATQPSSFFRVAEGTLFVSAERNLTFLMSEAEAKFSLASPENKLQYSSFRFRLRMSALRALRARHPPPLASARALHRYIYTNTAHGGDTTPEPEGPQRDVRVRGTPDPLYEYVRYAIDWDDQSRKADSGLGPFPSFGRRDTANNKAGPGTDLRAII